MTTKKFPTPLTIISQILPKAYLRESIGNNFENEGSCKKIKENFDNENFSFEVISKKDVLDLIKGLLGNKATVPNASQFQY